MRHSNVSFTAYTYVHLIEGKKDNELSDFKIELAPPQKKVSTVYFRVAFLLFGDERQILSTNFRQILLIFDKFSTNESVITEAHRRIQKKRKVRNSLYSNEFRTFLLAGAQGLELPRSGSNAYNRPIYRKKPRILRVNQHNNSNVNNVYNPLLAQSWHKIKSNTSKDRVATISRPCFSFKINWLFFFQKSRPLVLSG